MKKQHHLFLNAAKRMGAQITDVSLDFQELATIIDYQGKSELILNGTPTSLINLRSKHYCDNKQITKSACKILGIPAPASVVFKRPDEPQLKELLNPLQMYVCKPLSMANGLGVQLHINSLEGIEAYWLEKKQLSQNFLLEEQIIGVDLRIQIIGGKIAAACTREPAHVIGDGKNNLKELIEIFQEEVQQLNPANKLEIEETSNELLRQQGVQMTDIIPKGKKIELKEVANMSQGAIANDITDQLPNFIHERIEKLVKYLGVGYLGVDMIAVDVNDEAQVFLLEANADPEWVHHTFSRGKKHDIATMVLQSIFI